MIIIEHNMDVIKTADYIIDLGPEGGDAGGCILTEGPPEKIIKSKSLYKKNVRPVQRTVVFFSKKKNGK